MAEKPPKSPPKPPPGPPPSEGASQAQIARELARSLGMEAASQDAAEADAAAAGGEATSGETKLKLDKSGALIGIEKLRPVKAHPRPGGDAPPAAPSPAPPKPASASGAAPAASPPASARAPAAAGAAAAPPANAPKRAVLPPRIGAYVPPGFPGSGAGEDEVEIPGGAFLYGEDKGAHFVGPFRIDRLPVTHGAYERFVRETGHRAPLYWPAGHVPEDLRDHPVVGVDYFDALAYARWLGKDLPYEDEWERAARGTDGRSWPWGEGGDLSYSNTARQGLKMTVPVGFHPQNESPDGVKDLVGNVWQLTHSPAPGGGVVVRGGSWFDFAFHAKTWFRFAARPTARNGTIGFRCVRRPAPRDDAPREVDPSSVEAEIAGRRGPQPPVDPSQFSPDRRDLVPDVRRLRVLLAEKQLEDAVGSGGAGALRTEPSTPPRASQATPPAPAPKAPPPHPKTPYPAASKPLPPPAPKAAPSAPPAASPSAPPAASPATPQAPLHVELPTGRSVPAAPPSVRVPPPPPPAPEPESPPPDLEKLAGQRTPRALWILLGVGFALLLGLVFWLQKDDPKPDKRPTPPTTSPDDERPFVPEPGAPEPVEPGPQPPPPDELPDLPAEPEAGAGALDGQPPRLLDGATGTWSERVSQGPWLLVFAGGDDEEAARLTRRAALSLHRRLEGSRIRVALVTSRSGFESADSVLVEPALLDARLTQLEARDGLTVLLDPRRDGKDVIREGRYALGTPNAALLLVDGKIEVQTQPPEGGMSLKRLQPIAERARDFVK